MAAKPCLCVLGHETGHHFCKMAAVGGKFDKSFSSEKIYQSITVWVSYFTLILYLNHLIFTFIQHLFVLSVFSHLFFALFKVSEMDILAYIEGEIYYIFLPICP
jgi:hypothetical protein